MPLGQPAHFGPVQVRQLGGTRLPSLNIVRINALAKNPSCHARNNAEGRHGLGHHRVSADHRVAHDGHVAENLAARPKVHIILDDRQPAGFLSAADRNLLRDDNVPPSASIGMNDYSTAAIPPPASASVDLVPSERHRRPALS